MISRWTEAWRASRLGRALETLADRLPQQRLLAVVAGSLLVFTLVLHYLLIDRTQVNWDEFNFLSGVYLTAHGEQTRVLQTAHGHLFSWLLWMRGNEVDHILAARHVMYVLVVATAVLLGWVGNRLIGGSAGLFAALVYLTFAYVLRHGTAFRYDPLIVACLFGAAAALLAESRPKLSGAIAGLLGAAALIISIKSLLLLLPLGALSALSLLDAPNRRQNLTRFASFVLSGIVFSAAFYALHRLSLAPAAESARVEAAGAAKVAINFDKPFPKVGYWIASLRWEPFKWALILIGLAIAGGDLLYARDLRDRVRSLQLLALASPLTTIYFYRNSYPYFYVTILPGGCLLAGCLWRRLELARTRRLLAAGIAILCGLIVARSAWRWYAHNNRDETVTQRKVIDTIHAMFPEPVAYIDRCGMVSSFEKVGPFMSSWGMSVYRRAGNDIFPRLLRQKRPRFLLANISALDLDREVNHVPRGYRWRPGDHEQLLQNFVHYWGPIWLAGKSLTLERGRRAMVEIFVPGPYTLQADGPVEIDGALVQPNGRIDLKAGKHRLDATGDHDRKVVLRWGALLPRPGVDWKHVLHFRGFGLNPPPP